MAGIFHGDDVYSGFSQIEADDFDFTAPEAEILVVDDNSVNIADGISSPVIWISTSFFKSAWLLLPFCFFFF